MADDLEVDLGDDLWVELDLHLVGAGAVDFGHVDVAAIHFLLGGGLNGFSHITVGHRPEQHVVAAGLLLHREAADRVEGGAEGDGFKIIMRALTPASLGVQGPGEITRCVGFSASAAASSMASLRTTSRAVSVSCCSSEPWW